MFGTKTLLTQTHTYDVNIQSENGEREEREKKIMNNVIELAARELT